MEEPIKIKISIKGTYEISGVTQTYDKIAIDVQYPAVLYQDAKKMVDEILSALNKELK